MTRKMSNGSMLSSRSALSRTPMGIRDSNRQLDQSGISKSPINKCNPGIPHDLAMSMEMM